MMRTGIIGLALCTALILTGACYASPDLVKENQSDGSYVDHTLHSWRGFATNDAQSHVLRISVESKKTLDPAEVGKLLGSNASIDEIYSRIGEAGGEAVSKGYLRIGKKMTLPEIALGGDKNRTAGKQGTYELVNMKMSPAWNFTVIDSDVADLGYSGQNSTAKIVGHLILNASDLGLFPGSEVTYGQLVMDGGPFPGKYRVLLETQTHLATFTNASGDSGLPDLRDMKGMEDLSSVKAVRDAGIGPGKVVIVKKDRSLSPEDAMLGDGPGSERIVVIKKDRRSEENSSMSEAGPGALKQIVGLL